MRNHTHFILHTQYVRHLACMYAKGSATAHVSDTDISGAFCIIIFLYICFIGCAKSIDMEIVPIVGLSTNIPVRSIIVKYMDLGNR